ncbi:nuclear distribution protein nudE-like 1-B isoform X1 [Tribolium madens]|uniref:nuclear distribution protein nudE-like 1-B isoform X1 n=1 Tax=Tribolium madens TaxID=41895 RepID=UPI001CF7230A|nr:nuclear distribution protein nudE-like 1-B isoform X1 [Tribolium madens]
MNRKEISKGDQPTFENKDEEVEYWKNLATQYLDDIDRLQKESDEFVSESQQLEREYEATIEQNEKKIKELTLANNRAFNEIESLRVKLDQSNKQNQSYQTEIENFTKGKGEMSRYIRELEQKNDDLERSRRIIEESIAGIETAFHNAIERNAILESEIDEKESLKEKLQRLADETRDLKQELLVKEKSLDNERPVNGFRSMPIVDSNRLKEIETQTTPIKKDQIPYQASITPASRVMALNIVSDLIRKVGGLERRLEKSRYDYRDIGSSDLRSRHSAKNSPAPSIQGLSK